MRGVAGQEDGADPVVGDHPDVEAPRRSPAHGAQAHPGPASVDDLPEGRVGRFAAGRGGGLELPARARRQRAEGDEVRHHAVRPAPLVPVVAVEALELDVGDQHPHLLARLAEERHAEQAPDRAAAAVGTDDEARAHGADGRGDGSRRPRSRSGPRRARPARRRPRARRAARAAPAPPATAGSAASTARACRSSPAGRRARRRRRPRRGGGDGSAASCARGRPAGR